MAPRRPDLLIVRPRGAEARRGDRTRDPSDRVGQGQRLPRRRGGPDHDRSTPVCPATGATSPPSWRTMGRTIDDVQAVLLTHAHDDHIGFAERIRTEASIPIGVHEADVALRPGRVQAERTRAAGRCGPSRSSSSSCMRSARATCGRSTSVRSPRSVTAPRSTCRARRRSSTSRATRPGAPRSTCPLGARSSWATRS